MRVAFHSDIDVAFAPKRRNVVHRQFHRGEPRPPAQLQGNFPWSQAFGDLIGICIGVGRFGDGLWREDSAGLMLPVAGMNPSPTVDHDLRTKRANHADDVFERNVAPDSHRVFGAFREAEINRAREKMVHAVAVARREQFLGANDSELAALLRPDRVLAALAARDREVRDIGVESARKIGQQAGPFIVGMSGDEEDSRGDARFVDRFDSVRQRLRRDGCGSSCNHHHGRKNSERDSNPASLSSDFLHIAQMGSNGHWRSYRARPKYTRIPIPMAASEASIGVRPVRKKIPIQPSMAITTGNG